MTCTFVSISSQNALLCRALLTADLQYSLFQRRGAVYLPEATENQLEYRMVSTSRHP